MNTVKNTFSGLEVDVIAHSDGNSKLLLIEAKCTAKAEDQAEPQIRLALVIDRSGSMAGPKLDITRKAASRFIRSLSARDKVGLVCYDNEVQLLAGMQEPSEQLANKALGIEPGGSTNLYGGWVTGAKRVGKGGRVILLSDGLANEGRFTHARQLAQHSNISYQKYGVTTTTIGVGSDYDEALMSSMARKGGGSHYFAHDVDGIMNAFSQERFSIGSVALSQVSIKVGGEVFQLGHLWAGEIRRLVVPVESLSLEATIRYTPGDSPESQQQALELPREFGYSDLATLELIIEEAAELEEAAISVRNPESARAAKEKVRSLTLKLLSHPLADSEMGKAVASRLEQALSTLERLEVRYDESEASMHRKRALQSSHNLRNPAKAYSSFIEDSMGVLALRESSASLEDDELRVETVDARTVRLAPIDSWRNWKAVPLSASAKSMRVIMVNPRDGFVIAEMEKQLGLKVIVSPRAVSEGDLMQALDQIESALTPS